VAALAVYNALVARLVFSSLMSIADDGAGLRAPAARAAPGSGWAPGRGARLLAVAARSCSRRALLESATLRVDFRVPGRVLDLSSERVSEWLDPAERLLQQAPDLRAAPRDRWFAAPPLHPA